MSGTSSFNADDIVEPMAWDFSKYGGGEGVIPEPTDKQFRKYQKDILATMKNSGIQELMRMAQEMQEGAGQDPLKAMEALASLPEDAMDKVEEGMLTAVAELTSNCPSVEQIQTLPMRPRRAFYGWLSGQFAPKERSIDMTSVRVGTTLDGMPSSLGST